MENKSWKDSNTLTEAYDFSNDFFEKRSQMVSDIYRALLSVCDEWKENEPNGIAFL